jgi:hypothetical protein
MQKIKSFKNIKLITRVNYLEEVIMKENADINPLLIQ